MHLTTVLNNHLEQRIITHDALKVTSTSLKCCLVCPKQRCWKVRGKFVSVVFFPHCKASPNPQNNHGDIHNYIPSYYRLHLHLLPPCHII